MAQVLWSVALYGGMMALASAVLVVLFLVFLFLLKWRLRRPQKPPARDFQEDFTNVLILFQTMRDVLHRQKELAKEFNASVDKKVTLIRQTVKDALADHERLRNAQRDLVALLDETKAELANLRAWMASLRELPEKAGDCPPTTPAAVPSEAIPEGTHPAELEAQPSPPVSAAPPVSPEEGDLIDNWVGLDFGEDDAGDAARTPARPAAPEAPEDANAAREAFRALLNMGPGEEGKTPEAIEGPATPMARQSGNGRGRLTPVQARVYEYSDAGMSVAQIAHELGIGKGEVRLILSLRAEKGR